MNQHEQEIKRAVDQFRNKVNEINTSDNPIYKDEEVRQFYVKQHRAELDAKVAELSNQFDATITQEIEQAEAQAKTARFYTPQAEKEQVAYALESYTADVVMARTDNDKYEAYNRLLDRIEGMSDGGYAFLRLQLPAALSRVNGDEIATKDLRKVNDAFAELKTPEEERLDELKAAKRLGADQAYKRLRFTHPAYSHLRDNQHSGSFNRGQ